MAHKLLLADDSVTIQRVIELTFADEDIQVVAVGDGQQAIDRIRDDRPDIVLADAVMPERNGFEVAAFVRSRPEFRDIPVLLLTGAFEPVDEGRVREAGCDGVLAKPFEPQVLIGRVKELLARAASTARAAEEAEALMGYRQPSEFSERRQTARPYQGVGEGPFQSPSSPVPSWDDSAPREREAGRGVPGVEVEAIPARAEAVPEPASAVAGGVPADEVLLASGTDPVAPLSLDDYFDRLDAAFASLKTTPDEPPAEPPVEEARSAVETWFAGAPEPDWTSVQPLPEPDHLVEPVEEREDEGRRPVTDAPPTIQAPRLSAAFAALLAAEEGGPEPEPGSRPLSGQAVEELVEEVVRRVVERLADQSVRDQVAGIVSTIAERLVREEIARLKSSL